MFTAQVWVLSYQVKVHRIHTYTHTYITQACKREKPGLACRNNRWSHFQKQVCHNSIVHSICHVLCNGRMTQPVCVLPSTQCRQRQAPAPVPMNSNMSAWTWELGVLRRLSHLLKRGYNGCRIYKKAQIINSLSLIVFLKSETGSPNSTTHKTEWFLRESGDILSLFIPLLLFTLVDNVNMLFALCCSVKCC